MLNFVGNGRCSRALDWSAEAAFREAGFRVNQTIITNLNGNFYVIIKSLLPVLTVKMVLLLHIIKGGGSRPFAAALLPRLFGNNVPGHILPKGRHR